MQVQCITMHSFTYQHDSSVQRFQELADLGVCLSDDEATDAQLQAATDDMPLSLDSFPDELQEPEEGEIAEAFQLLEDSFCFKLQTRLI